MPEPSIALWIAGVLLILAVGIFMADVALLAYIRKLRDESDEMRKEARGFYEEATSMFKEASVTFDRIAEREQDTVPF